MKSRQTERLKNRKNTQEKGKMKSIKKKLRIMRMPLHRLSHSSNANMHIEEAKARQKKCVKPSHGNTE